MRDFKAIEWAKSYHDEYGQYLEFFKEVTPGEKLRNVPISWVPLLMYLGAVVETTCTHFPEDLFAHDPRRVATLLGYEDTDRRLFVEHCCTLRPELVDALWKCDNQWAKDNILEGCSFGGLLVITNNNSFNRLEIKRFIDTISHYRTEYSKCVITNCSAEKPYPAPTHKKLKEMYPDHELLVVSGVTGIVPESAFEFMPEYDSGLPNLWNVKYLAEQYFKRNQYREIVVLTEFNQYPLNEVLYTYCRDAKIISILPHEQLYDYYITAEYLAENENTLRR